MGFSIKACDSSEEKWYIDQDGVSESQWLRQTERQTEELYEHENSQRNDELRGCCAYRLFLKTFVFSVTISLWSDCRVANIILDFVRRCQILQKIV